MGATFFNVPGRQMTSRLLFLLPSEVDPGKQSPNFEVCRLQKMFLPLEDSLSLRQKVQLPRKVLARDPAIASL